jgi:hypothetical protein
VFDTTALPNSSMSGVSKPINMRVVSDSIVGLEQQRASSTP